MKLPRRAPALIVSILYLVSWSGTGVAQPSRGSAEIELPPSAAFERARSQFRSGSFEECVESYEQLFSHGRDFPEDITQEVVEEARVYFSACLLALGRGDEAEAQMSAAIDENRQMSSPDPVIFPSQVLDLFFKVRHRFLEKIQEEQEKEKARADAERQRREELERKEAERVEELERLAAQEFLVHENQRWIAWLPFGVGQFQNGDATLGAVFLTAETLFLGTTIAAVSISLDTHSQAGGKRVRSDPFNDQLELAYRVHLAAGGAFLLTAGLGILEAHVNFVPEQRLRSRPRSTSSRPPSEKVRVAPSVRPTEGGAVLGVVGRF